MIQAERREPALHEALLAIARHKDSRSCLVLLASILENPGLAERLMEVLKPEIARPEPARPGKNGRRV